MVQQPVPGAGVGAGVAGAEVIGADVGSGVTGDDAGLGVGLLLLGTMVISAQFQNYNKNKYFKRPKL